jgi:hypothetical protein
MTVIWCLFCDPRWLWYWGVRYLWYQWCLNNHNIRSVFYMHGTEKSMMTFMTELFMISLILWCQWCLWSPCMILMALIPFPFPSVFVHCDVYVGIRDLWSPWRPLWSLYCRLPDGLYDSDVYVGLDTMMFGRSVLSMIATVTVMGRACGLIRIHDAAIYGT